MSTFFGIDLGTSHCALAVAGEGAPELIPLPQVVSAHGIGEPLLLPSAIYLPPEGESTPLPWAHELGNVLIGTFARERGALQPDRLITSAKSWLCHPHADPRSPILPWGSETVAQKWSPLEVSRRLLEHLLAAHRHQHPDQPLDATHGVVTVPASFDEAARSLTLEAVRQAGLGEITLLEEPQAAFYAWLEAQGNEWRAQVQPGHLLLVCDVGGGTADFSLIAVVERDAQLSLERIAVGEHLLLGGDNMDLALAHAVSGSLQQEREITLDEWQFLALIQACSRAKEELLGNSGLNEVSLSIPTRGRSLVASTLRAALTREQVESFLVEGFFPRSGPEELPQLRRAGGLREAGLPYAADAAISRHLARFFARAKANVAASPALAEAVGGAERLERGLYPDAVLFNGGVFNAEVLRRCVLDLLSDWAQRPVRELTGGRPDHAVALGAAAYARLRTTGRGVRIKAGTARSYYIGMETAAMAVPGMRPPVKALCVAPQGMEEGAHHVLEGETFYLYTGEPVEFRFFASEVRSGDIPGTLLPHANGLDETARLEVTLPPPENHLPGEEIPVRLETVVTELGNLELYLVQTEGGQRWKLELNVRME